MMIINTLGYYLIIIIAVTIFSFLVVLSTVQLKDVPFISPPLHAVWWCPILLALVE
jgi:hypothetical protein